MEYTGNYRTMYSELCGEDVSILEYRSRDNIPYCECTRCGKDIKRRMFVVQSKETDVELMYLGADCIKQFT